MKLNKEGFEEKASHEVGFRTGNLIFENRIAHEWLTTESAAQYLGVTPNALRIMVHRNQIRSYKIGRRLRFKTDDCRTLFKPKGV